MESPTTTPLTTEIAAYEAQRTELEKTYPGKFVVFKGDQFIGAWDTLKAAASVAIS